MTRAAVLLAVVAGIGATLLLDAVRALRRPALGPRLARHRPDQPAPVRPATPAEVILPLLVGMADAATAVLGVHDELPVRLRRARRSNPAAHRIRQVGWAGAGLVAAVGVVVLVRPGPLPALLLGLGLPALGFLLAEHELARAGRLHQDRVRRELPVVAEQLGMLIASGFSLGGALHRLAERSTGAVSDDLADVNRRVHHGVDPVDALRDWAGTLQLDGARRLVSVLALHRVTTDLGPLIEQESRAIRAEAQRDLLTTIERRNQQVWVPVTVATLVPGVLLLSVPFVDALAEFGRL